LTAKKNRWYKPTTRRSREEQGGHDEYEPDQDCPSHAVQQACSECHGQSLTTTGVSPDIAA